MLIYRGIEVASVVYGPNTTNCQDVFFSELRMRLCAELQRRLLCRFHVCPAGNRVQIVGWDRSISLQVLLGLLLMDLYAI
jgi:hypothetical protein